MEARAVPPDAACGRRTLDAGAGRFPLSTRALALAPDASLVTLVRKGEMVAFRTIYERYQRGILSFCRQRREQPSSEIYEPVTEGLTAHVLRREDLRQLLVDLRRGNLRRHLQDCPACREFSGQIGRPRRRLTVVASPPPVQSP